MKKLFLLTLMICSTALGAVTVPHSGTVCKAYNGADAHYINYSFDGIRSNQAAATTTVICPLTRNTNNLNGAFINIGITHIGTRMTSCTGYSIGYTGIELISNTQIWTGSGRKTMILSLTGALMSNKDSHYVVSCDIPGYGNGILNSINVIEQ